MLVFEPAAGGPRTRERRRRITSLATGVEATGMLDEAAVQRVLATLDEYDAASRAHGCLKTHAFLTSAVREAADGQRLATDLRSRAGYDVTVLDELEEAELIFRGITSGRRDLDRSTVVLDVGGGSTEIVVGTRDKTEFAASLPIGAVRQLERHVKHDPPTAPELEALRHEVRDRLDEGVPSESREHVRHGIANAGTDSWLPAAGDSTTALTRDFLEHALHRMAAMTVAERSALPGIDPARASTLCVGAAILIEAMRTFGLDEIEMTSRGLLDGAALTVTGSLQ
jgi:exopolyphosphatase/guanosine-5'-triphosphate,3'-diphosphate pyrophosphatase